MSCRLPYPALCPRPRTSAGVTLRKDTGLRFLPQGSSWPSAGRGSDSFALPSMSLPCSLSYLLFPLKRAFFFQVQGSRPFLSRGLSVSLHSSWCLCVYIIHVLPRSLSNFCPGLFGPFVVSVSDSRSLGPLHLSLRLCLGLCVSLGVYRSLGSLWVSVASRHFALPRSSHPLGSSLTPPGSCHLPARPFPTPLIPHASGRRAAGRTHQLPRPLVSSVGGSWAPWLAAQVFSGLSRGALGRPPSPRSSRHCLLLLSGSQVRCVWVSILIS